MSDDLDKCERTTAVERLLNAGRLVAEALRGPLNERLTVDELRDLSGRLDAVALRLNPPEVVA